jgi:hypothetical protein
MRSRRRQKRFRPAPVLKTGLPDPFSAAFPDLVAAEDYARSRCPCCVDRETEILDREIMAEYDRDVERSTDESRERLWRGGKLDRHPGPSCFCDDCCEDRKHGDPTYEEYESYKRAFPHLEM